METAASSVEIEERSQELEAELAVAEQELVDAQREVGGAQLEQGDVSTAAMERLASARDRRDAIQAALTEVPAREEEARQREKNKLAAEARLAIYRWGAAYFEQAERAHEARDEADRQERALNDLGYPARLKQIHLSNTFPDESDLDNDFLRVVPARTHGDRSVPKIERCREGRELCERLLAEEAAREGPLPQAGRDFEAAWRKAERRRRQREQRESEENA